MCNIFEAMEKGGKVAVAWRAMDCVNGEKNAKERQTKLSSHHRQLEEKFKDDKVCRYSELKYLIYLTILQADKYNVCSFPSCFSFFNCASPSCPN